MWLYLVHHGDALPPDVDPQRPLSPVGRAAVDLLARRVASRGVRPAVIWHSGKLRSRQTAEAFWRACNPFAEFKVARGLQPTDGPQQVRDALRTETGDVMAVGHMPSLPRLLACLTTGDADGSLPFPAHGVVALESDERGLWAERWRTD